ncbi:GTP-binding protein [Paenibacillus tarimensis]
MRIPVIVLSGFLGSGKTTLLLKLLDEARSRGLQPGVIMNELGSMDVDGHILNENTGTPVQKLLDGCICCTKRSELAGGIQTICKQNPDVIFIELTGVANPEEIADALTEPKVLGLVSLKQIVTVLDAEHVLEYNSIFQTDLTLLRTLRRQIETADLILVNKSDLVNSPRLDKIDKTVRKLNDTAKLIHTTHSKIDSDLLLGSITQQVRQAIPVVRSRGALKAVPAQNVRSDAETTGDRHEHETLSYSRIKTLTIPISSESPLPSRKQIERFVYQFKDQLLRAKGYIKLDKEPSSSLMQYAGKRLNWSVSDYSGEPYIVFIGIDLNEQLLRMEWKREIG